MPLCNAETQSPPSNANEYEVTTVDLSLTSPVPAGPTHNIPPTITKDTCGCKWFHGVRERFQDDTMVCVGYHWDDTSSRCLVYVRQPVKETTTTRSYLAPRTQPGPQLSGGTDPSAPRTHPQVFRHTDPYVSAPTTTVTTVSVADAAAATRSTATPSTASSTTSAGTTSMRRVITVPPNAHHGGGGGGGDGAPSTLDEDDDNAYEPFASPTTTSIPAMGATPTPFPKEGGPVDAPPSRRDDWKAPFAAVLSCCAALVAVLMIGANTDSQSKRVKLDSNLVVVDPLHDDSIELISMHDESMQFIATPQYGASAGCVDTASDATGGVPRSSTLQQGGTARQYEMQEQVKLGQFNFMQSMASGGSSAGAGSAVATGSTPNTSTETSMDMAVLRVNMRNAGHTAPAPTPSSSGSQFDSDLDHLLGGADLASDMLDKYIKSASSVPSTHMGSATSWRVPATPQGLDVKPAVPPERDLFNLADLPSNFRAALPPQSNAGKSYELSVVNAVVQFNQESYHPQEPPPQPQQHRQQQQHRQIKQEHGEAALLFDTTSGLPSATSFSPVHFLGGAGVPAVHAVPATIAPVTATVVEECSPYRASSGASQGYASAGGYVPTTGTGPGYEIPQQMHITPLNQATAARLAATNAGDLGNNLTAAGKPADATNVAIDDTLWSSLSSVASKPVPGQQTSTSVVPQHPVRVTAVDEIVRQWTVVKQAAMERAGVDPRTFGVPSVSKSGGASPAYSAGSSSGNNTSSDSGSVSPNHPSMGGVEIGTGHTDSIRDERGRWNTWALSLGASARNAVAKRFSLTPEETKDLKKQSRKLKQSVAQQKYLKKKKEERQEAKRKAEADGSSFEPRKSKSKEGVTEGVTVMIEAVP